MKKQYLIKLDDFDLGQAVDGLEVRAKVWEDTAHYLTTGDAPAEFFIQEECNSPREARQLARHYRKILDSIRKQMRQQDAEPT